MYEIITKTVRNKVRSLSYISYRSVKGWNSTEKGCFGEELKGFIRVTFLERLYSGKLWKYRFTEKWKGIGLKYLPYRRFRYKNQLKI